jgi:hypothetical protein
MKTKNEITSWGIRSASYWMAMLVALGIIFVGIRFIAIPQTAAQAFGIPFSSTQDLVFGRIKGIRDIFSGIVLLPLLLLRMRTATAYVFTAAIIIPATDCLLVLLTNGLDVPHMLIHGLTAAFMAITSFLLLNGKQKTTI